MLLNQRRINSPYIPDDVEQRLYEQVLGVIVDQIKQILEDTRVEFLDHEIRFVLVPKAHHTTINDGSSSPATLPTTA